MNKKRKKIAFIIQHLTNGGAERTISNLSLCLDKYYEITLIIFDGNNVTYPYAGKLINLNLPPIEGKVNKIINAIRRIKCVKEIKKIEKFDCVVSFMFGANIVNVLSKNKEKVIISARNHMSAYGVSIIDVFREKFLLKFADLEVALSKMVEHDLVHSFGLQNKKIVTIYNPCDVEKIKRLSQEKCNYKFKKDIFYIITAGRMVKQKGQWHLIKAFYEFKKEVFNSRLIILGDGELNDELKKLARTLKLENDIDFLGFVDNPYSYIANSSCFVLSSLFEGLGNVIIEAMSCSTPVISYDCLSGPRELISPETDILQKAKTIEIATCGILVPSCEQNIDFDPTLSLDDYNLANAIYLLYKNPELGKKIKENAMKRIEKFNPTIITEEWSRLF